MHNCGPRGCADCRDDGSAGYKACCGVKPGCEWVNTCGSRGCPDCRNDGSPGYKQCCGGGGPTPPSPPGPGPSPGPISTYCPSASDLTIAYGHPQLLDQGWEIHGNGGVATKSTYNLIGGSVEFDIDFSSVDRGVNANIYTVCQPLARNPGKNLCPVLNVPQLRAIFF